MFRRLCTHISLPAARLTLVIVTLFLMRTPTVRAIVYRPLHENIALEKPVAASSVESSFLAAENVNDGDLNTRWSSQFTDHEWIAIDLQSAHEVQQIVLHWEAAYAESYDIELSSDGFVWQTVFEERSSDGHMDIINLGTPVVARFVRMTGVARATDFGYSLFEFEIYEPDAAFRYVAANGEDVDNDCLDASHPCATVGYAIGRANPGNTIEIAAGTYTESFTIDRSINLLGAGEDGTIVQAHAVPGTAGARVITIASGLNIEISGVTIRHGQVTGSGAAGEGGGIFIRDSAVLLRNVTLHANAARSGGGLYNKDNGRLTLEGVTFSGNRASAVGGGLRNFGGSDAILQDVLFIDNQADRGGGMANNSGTHTLNEVTLALNRARLGGGLYNVNSSPHLVDVVFDGNEADESGGGVYNNASGSTLQNVTFVGNRAGNGGGIYNVNSSSPMLTNALFHDNEAIGGGGILNLDNSSPQLTNVTLHGNRAMAVGGGLLNLDESAVTLFNTIIWGNVADSGGNEIYNDFDASSRLHYTLYRDDAGDIVEGGGFDTGQNSLVADPLFADPVGGDLHLQMGSPARNAGDPQTDLSVFPDDAQGNALDLNRRLRLQEARIDLGAFEYGSQTYFIYLPVTRS